MEDKRERRIAREEEGARKGGRGRKRKKLRPFLHSTFTRLGSCSSFEVSSACFQIFLEATMMLRHV